MLTALAEYVLTEMQPSETINTMSTKIRKSGWLIKDSLLIMFSPNYIFTEMMVTNECSVNKTELGKDS